MIPLNALKNGNYSGAPRTSGDDPKGYEYCKRAIECSPHERG